MRLNRFTALLIAVLTLAPWAYFVYFLSRFIPTFAAMSSSSPPAPPNQFFEDFDLLFRLHLLVMLLIVALMAFYIFHLFRTDRVPSDKKALWAVVLFLGNLLAMPVYWYLYMWPRDAEGAG
jgi:hypothetical protein